jgi:hypothetical protein
MSETRTNIEKQLFEINVPNLNDADYAKQLSQSFSNIDTNFKKLSNRDFIKGENGDSVKIVEEELIDSSFINSDNPLDGLTSLGKMLIEAIELKYDSKTLKDIEYSENEYSDTITLSWLDNFISNPGKLYTIYDATAVEFDEDKIVSSLYYTFLDGRYSNKYTGRINAEEYDEIKDVSCIMVYDKNENNGKGGFKILANAFPTIYYEDGLGLCWKVNGANTGIPVQGIPGKNGKNTLMTIVKANISSSDEYGLMTGNVTHIFEPFYGYREVKYYDALELQTYDNTTALILTSEIKRNGTEYETETGYNFYFGSLKTKVIKDDNNVTTLQETNVDNNETITTLKLQAICTPSTNINGDVKTQDFINAMKSINIKGGENISWPRGLFIPMDGETINETSNGDIVDIVKTQPVHLMTATPIVSDTEGSSTDIKSDLIFTPINDYNSIGDDNKNVIVNKYLYLRLNKDDQTIKDHKDDKKWNDVLNNYNGVLKYKLETKVLYVNASDFNEYDNKTGIGSRMFGTNKLEGSDFIDKNVRYKTDSGVVSDHIDSMPTNFINRLGKSDEDKPIGIYKWTLYTGKADYDIDELKKSNGDSENYEFPEHFKTIYTTDITPSIDTDFLWFDGYTFYDIDKYKHVKEKLDKSEPTTTIEDIKNNYPQLYYKTQYPIIRGWYTELFSFIKFVPIYINDYTVNDDTSLNLNYNVNITGDENNPNKSITVHGSINCDNINVHKLSTSGEIKNIYTTDEIIGEAGIKLGRNNTSGKFGFEVYKTGETTLSKGLNANIINVETEIVDNSNITKLNVNNAEISDAKILNTLNIELPQTKESLNNTPLISISKNNNVFIDSNSIIDNNIYFTIEDLSGTANTITFTPGTSNEKISYSINNAGWKSSNSISLPANGSVRIKGNLTPASANGIGTFSATGNYRVYGNVMSLLYGDSFVNKELVNSHEYVFCRLFYNNTKLIDASKLILPATTLIDSCYALMFYGCTSLTTAPIELPATTLASGCYTLMFSGCTSLTTAPELPAAVLKSTCYTSMFNNCANLSYIKMTATNISAYSCLADWVKGVSSTGTFVKHPDMTLLSRGSSGIPSNWDVEDNSEKKDGVDVNGTNLNIDMDVINKININSPDVYNNIQDKYIENDKVPVITSGIPTLFNNGNNIIVTNDDKDNKLIYYKNLKKDFISDKPAGDGINMSNASFDSVKNFNVHRFYSFDDNNYYNVSTSPLYHDKFFNSEYATENLEFIDGTNVFSSLSNKIVKMTDKDGYELRRLVRFVKGLDPSYRYNSYFKTSSEDLSSLNESYISKEADTYFEYIRKRSMTDINLYNNLKNEDIKTKTITSSVLSINYKSPICFNMSIYATILAHGLPSERRSWPILLNSPADGCDSWLKFGVYIYLEDYDNSGSTNPTKYFIKLSDLKKDLDNKESDLEKVSDVKYSFKYPAAVSLFDDSNNDGENESIFAMTEKPHRWIGFVDDDGLSATGQVPKTTKYYLGNIQFDASDYIGNPSLYTLLGLKNDEENKNKPHIAWRFRTFQLFPKTIDIPLSLYVYKDGGNIKFTIKDILENKNRFRNTRICIALSDMKISVSNTVNYFVDYQGSTSANRYDNVHDIRLYSNFAPYNGIKHKYANKDLDYTYYDSNDSKFKDVIGSINIQTYYDPNDKSILKLPVEETLNVYLKKYKDNIANLSSNYYSLNYFRYNDYAKIYTNKIDYIKVQENKNNTLESTNICTNGIVSRSGNYTFGLGYSNYLINHDSGNSYISVNNAEKTLLYNEGFLNKDEGNIIKGEPVLFYYDHGAYKGDTNLPNDSAGYARRVNSIRLSELFNMLKSLRTSSTTSSLMEYGI